MGGFSGENKLKSTYAYFLAFIALGMTAAVLGPTLPGLARQTGTTETTLGIQFTIRSLGFFFGSLVGGRLYDRLPGHLLLTGALLIIASTSAFIPFIPFALLLGVVMFFMGIGESGIDVGTNTMLIWTHGSKVAPYMNSLHFFFGLGAVISPIIVAQFLTLENGLQTTYLILAGLMVLPILFIFRLESPKPRALSPESDEKGPIRPLLLALFILFFILYVGVEVGYTGWIFTYAFRTGLMNETGAAYLTSGFWIAFTTGRLLSIPAALRIRPAHLQTGSILLGLAAVGSILLFPGSPAVLWAGTILAGLAFAPMFPTMMSLAERYMHLSGKVTSYFFAGVSLGSLTLPWTFGQVMAAWGYIWMVRLVFISLVLLAGVLVLLFRMGNAQEKGMQN